MANDVQTTPEPGLASLVTGITDDLHQLIRQQITLVRQEIQEDVHKAKEGTTEFALGAGVAGAGAILVGFTVVYILAATTTLPLWGCFAMVTGVFVAAAAALIVVGKKRLESIDPLHNQAVEGLKENMQWQTNPR
jgi:ABC-type uncharacterized transport system fused permease/ATPase subunit